MHIDSYVVLTGFGAPRIAHCDMSVAFKRCAEANWKFDWQMEVLWLSGQAKSNFASPASMICGNSHDCEWCWCDYLPMRPAGKDGLCVLGECESVLNDMEEGVESKGP